MLTSLTFNECKSFSKFGWVMASVLLMALTVPNYAQAQTVRIASGYGIPYLPLLIMKNQNLVEKHAAEQGADGVEVEWLTLGNASVMVDALLSRNIEFAMLGTTPHILAWDRTLGSIGIRGVASFSALPQYLVTTNPNVNSIEDFGEGDRIALPAVKSSLQATQLQMAVAEIYGFENHEKLDNLTVSMSNPDGLAALRAGQISAHFSNPPFQNIELDFPNARLLLSSVDVLGGPSTNGIISTTTAVHNEHPEVIHAMVAALNEAMAMIREDQERAVDIYFEEDTGTQVSRDMVLEIIRRDDVDFSTTPNNTMKYADFMFQTGRINNMPESWQDMFFPEIHQADGS